MRVTLNTSNASTLRCAICNGRASQQASARVKPKRCVSPRRKVQQRVGEHRLLSGCECLLFSATSTRYCMGGTPDCREPSHPLSTLCMPVSMTLTECRGWLPAGKRAAVCFSVDDVHPATSEDEFDTEARSEEHTSELQSRSDLVCRLLLEKKKIRLNRSNWVNAVPAKDF